MWGSCNPIGHGRGIVSADLTDLLRSSHLQWTAPSSSAERRAARSSSWLGRSHRAQGRPMGDRRVVVTRNGPYRVDGGVPLIRTAVVETARGEPIAWEVGPSFDAPETYELCRCGLSSTKPFCDSTHERVGFEGDETANRGSIVARRQTWEKGGIVLYDDVSLCAKHGFCRNVRTGVWEMLEEAEDPEVRNEMIAMVHRCPSGRLALALAPERRPGEPELEPSI